MAWTTPGLDFLIRNLFIPSSINYGALSIATHSLRLVNAPKWVLATLAVLIIPARHICAAVYQQRTHRQQAEALGARMPPVVDTKTFGNRKLLTDLTDVWKTGYPGDTFWELCEQFGNVFNLRIMFADIVYTIDPNNVKRILSTDFSNFEKGERFRFAMAGVLGSGVFNSDGEMWKSHRTMARPFFSRDRVTDLEHFDKHIQSGITLMKERMKTGYAIDFQDLVSRVTMDISSEFLFGTSVNSLDILSEDLPQPYNHPEHYNSVKNFPKYPANAFSEAFLSAQTIAAGRDRMGWIWPLAEIFGDKIKKDMKVVDDFLVPIVKEAVKKNAERVKLDGPKEEAGDDQSFLDHLAGNTSDFAVLKDQALNFLLAGRDTTASTLTSLFYLLSQHPHVLQRLREEVLDKVGPLNRPSYQDVKEMKYLRAVINETLRILPPLPWDVRECVNGALWPSPDPNDKPIYIPPGSATAYGIMMIQTTEELWGPDAAEFDPDRFLDDRKNYILANPYIFMPFNAGPRICIGQQLAYNELSIAIIRLLQAFSSFTLDKEAFPPADRVPEDWANGRGRKAKEQFKPKVVLIMSSQGGMWLKAKPAEEE